MPPFSIGYAESHPYFSKHARHRRAIGRIVLLALTLTVWSVLIINYLGASDFFVPR